MAPVVAEVQVGLTWLANQQGHRRRAVTRGRYVRYSDVDNTMDAGYPAYININWLPFPK